MTTNTPNRGLEAMLFAAHSTGKEITAKELSAQKSRDVEAVTESTVRVLETERIKNVQLRGKNIELPLQFLDRCADGLLTGDLKIPANICWLAPRERRKPIFV
jgi:hypothetical protein